MSQQALSQVLNDDSKKNITTDHIVKILNLNKDAQDELDKIDQYDFNIFKLRDATKENELVTVLSYLHSKLEVLSLVHD